MFGGIDSVDDNEEDEAPAAESTGSNAAPTTSTTTATIGADAANSSSSDATSERSPGYLPDLIALHVQSAQPNQGEVWCATGKETKLRRLTPAALLPVVAERILGYAPSLHTLNVPATGK